MKMWAFSKPRRTCYCHFPVFLATGGVRPKYQFFTAAEFKKSQEVIRGGERGNRVRPSILPHVTGNHIQYCQNTEKGRRKNIENKTLLRKYLWRNICRVFSLKKKTLLTHSSRICTKTASYRKVKYIQK